MDSSVNSSAGYTRSETDVEGYTRIKNLFIPMRDGVELCADLFLPFSTSKYGQKTPVLCSLGPYGKDTHASVFGLPQTPIYAEMYKHIKPLGPDACFELCDPLIWTKDFGYALLRVDARGIGGSQGKLDPFGLERSLVIQDDAEGQDLYDVVEWAGTQSWSTGKVAFSGISYYGMVGYWAAMQKPPHLTCVVSYEAQCNMYQSSRRAGIYSHNFQSHWYNNIVVPQQAGRDGGILSEEALVKNRVDFPGVCLNTEYPTEGVWDVLGRVRKLSGIEVPIYLAGNWTDPELHLPGNIRAYNGASSKFKWLEMHTGNHLAAFYDPEHIRRQRQFLDYFLFAKADNGMMDVPKIRLIQHHGTSTFYRESEQRFPPPDSEDVTFYLNPNKTLSLVEPKELKMAFDYQGLRDNIEFTLDYPFADSFEILGSPYLELEVVTEAQDLDLFIYLRALTADRQPIILVGNHGEPMDSFARGYFRLSHRKEIETDFTRDKVISQPPVPKSDVVPGKKYTITVPLFPAAFLFDQGQSLQLEIGSVNSKSVIPAMRHEGGDRTEERFGGRNVIFSHGKLVLPRVHRA
ncbi:PepX-C domain-containing protein [Fusarium keratoplasticum]|uniref:PepX-C domain-containing protein n=1 Tax=Fusarium keratoplasticum TaxID=1328300 RepID=A0ACC0QZK8_9HYPO|nr:PepX-C domain-containing protein [Fusarium keratoplasticum]KAI8670559.1 PepX-C domain-containing protein [Fusarium keratoplasticum]